MHVDAELKYISPAELGKLTNTPLSTLTYWRKTGKGPPSEQAGPRSRVRYPRVAAYVWILETFPSAIPAGQTSTDRQ